jgi:hypothetical protein
VNLNIITLFISVDCSPSLTCKVLFVQAKRQQSTKKVSAFRHHVTYPTYHTPRLPFHLPPEQKEHLQPLNLPAKKRTWRLTDTLSDGESLLTLSVSISHIFVHVRRYTYNPYWTLAQWQARTGDRYAYGLPRLLNHTQVLLTSCEGKKVIPTSSTRESGDAIDVRTGNHDH